MDTMAQQCLTLLADLTVELNSAETLSEKDKNFFTEAIHNWKWGGSNLENGDYNPIELLEWYRTYNF